LKTPVFLTCEKLSKFLDNIANSELRNIPAVEFAAKSRRAALPPRYSAAYSFSCPFE